MNNIEYKSGFELIIFFLAFIYWQLYFPNFAYCVEGQM